MTNLIAVQIDNLDLLFLYEHTANASVTHFGHHEQYFYEHNKIMTSLGSDFVFQSDATILEDAILYIHISTSTHIVKVSIRSECLTIHLIKLFLSSV